MFFEIKFLFLLRDIYLEGGRIMKWIDLRSDTVTMPTDAMREAMAKASVGDDVYEDDPTMRELEEYAAFLSGKEAALFTPSGTFANQLAIFTHCKRGDEVILPWDCHIVLHEVGASSVIAGVQLRTMSAVHGAMNAKEVEATIRTEDIHYPETGLICMENAYSDGTVVSLDAIKAVFEKAKEYRIPVHTDGARLFNAALSLNLEPKELLRFTDSAMFCLSKGLCAPIGSMLVGSKDFIHRARKKRKLMGGGMRQVGILASAGLIALKEMRERLSEDHENAKYLAKKLSEIPGIEVEWDCLDINMVFFRVTDEQLKINMTEKNFYENGIKINPEECGLFRFVAHNDLDREDIDTVIDFMKVIITKTAN